MQSVWSRLVALAFSDGAIQHVKTVTRKEYPELWENIVPVENAQEKNRGRTKRVIGLTENEKNLVHLLDTEIVQALENEIGNFADNTEEQEEMGEEKDRAQLLLRMALKHSDIKILDEILSDLKEFNQKKWANVSSEYLYPKLLTNVTEFNKVCTVPELALIGKAVEHKTGRKFFLSGVPKAVNVNTIAKAFGGDEFLALPARRENMKKKIKSLQQMAKEILSHDEYKTEQLQVSIANAIHREKRLQWLKKLPNKLNRVRSTFVQRTLYVPDVFVPRIQQETQSSGASDFRLHSHLNQYENAYFDERV